MTPGFDADRGRSAGRDLTGRAPREYMCDSFGWRRFTAPTEPIIAAQSKAVERR